MLAARRPIVIDVHTDVRKSYLCGPTRRDWRQSTALCLSALTGLPVVARHIAVKESGVGSDMCRACAGDECAPLLRAGASAVLVLGGGKDTMLQCSAPDGRVWWLSDRTGSKGYRAPIWPRNSSDGAPLPAGSAWNQWEPRPVT
jgi:hypothetical protein